MERPRTRLPSRGNEGNKLFRGALFRPQLWITLALVAAVLEGGVRKWAPGFSEGAGRLVAYFSKDVLFGLGAMLIVSWPVRPRRSTEIFSNWAIAGWSFIAVGAAISALEGVNPVGSALTLRALVFLPLLALIVAQRFSSFPLVPFAAAASALALLNLPLCLLQSGLSRDHFLNRYAAGETNIVEVAAGVRATGTFAYITGLGVMSGVGVWGGLVTLSLSRGWKYQAIGAAGVLAGFGCAFANVSRGAVVAAVAMVGVWAMGSVHSAKAMKPVWRMVGYGFLLTVVALLAVPGMADRFVHMGEGALDRFTSAGDSNLGRAFGQWSEMWDAINEHPMGQGLGTEQVGGNVAATGVAKFTSYENQFPRIVAELGTAGLLGFFVLVTGVMLALQQAKRDYPTAGFPLAMTATQLFFLSQSYAYLMVNHTASAATWLVVTAALAAVPTSVRGKVPSNRREGMLRHRTASEIAGAEKVLPSTSPDSA